MTPDFAFFLCQYLAAIAPPGSSSVQVLAFEAFRDLVKIAGQSEAVGLAIAQEENLELRAMARAAANEKAGANLPRPMPGTGTPAGGLTHHCRSESTLQTSAANACLLMELYPAAVVLSNCLIACCMQVSVRMELLASHMVWRDQKQWVQDRQHNQRPMGQMTRICRTATSTARTTPQ